MTVNPDAVDVSTSYKNKNTPKNTKNNNQLKTNRLINVKVSAKGVLHLACQEGRLARLPPSFTLGSEMLDEANAMQLTTKNLQNTKHFGQTDFQ